MCRMTVSGGKKISLSHQLTYILYKVQLWREYYIIILNHCLLDTQELYGALQELF